MAVENNVASINTNSQGHTISIDGTQISGLFINITKGSDADSISLEQLSNVLKDPDLPLVITPFTKKEGALKGFVKESVSEEPTPVSEPAPEVGDNTNLFTDGNQSQVQA